MPRVCVPGGDRSLKRMFQQQDYEVVDHLYQSDIIVFQGGMDVASKLYNERQLSCTYSNPAIDRRDIGFYDFGTVHKKPMVGVCRGAQFLNVMNGGALWQDVDNHGRSHEMVDLLVDHGSTLEVTSTHHQMMIPAKHGIELGIAFEAKKFRSASDRPQPDHDSEVVWYEDTRSLCVQFHPEYENKECRLYFFDLIDSLIL